MATGVGAFLEVDETNVSDFARSVVNNFTQDEVETTVLSSQFRRFEGTYARNVLTIEMIWSPAVQTFMDAHQPGPDSNNLAYEYGPEGNGAGKVKFSGTANVISAQQIPPSNPGQPTVVTMTLNLNSATVGTFSA